MSDTSRPTIKGFHHVKLAAPNWAVRLPFTKIFSAHSAFPNADHHKEADGKLYGYIVNVPDLGTKLELRLNPEQAEKYRRFDQFTLAVKDRDALSQWALVSGHPRHHALAGDSSYSGLADRR